MLRAAGLVLVRSDGLRASRLRVALRTAIAFAPVFIWWGGGLLLANIGSFEPAGAAVPPGASWVDQFAYLLGYNSHLIHHALGSWPGYAALAAMALGAIWSAIARNRGPHDHLAGTCLVPR